MNAPQSPPPGKPNQIRLGKYSMTLPGSKPWRIALGTVLVIGGCLGFLPILGFWMIPLGVLVLSVDLHPVRRLRRRFEVYWGRRKSSNGSKSK
jgi:hypothetical protein